VAFVTPLSKSAGIEPRPEPTGPSPTPAAAADFYGITSQQLHQINVPAAHAAGYTGDGIVIGVLDTGFKLTHEAFNQPGNVVNVLGQWDFINDDPVTSNEEGDLASQHNHGTRILGTIAAYMPDSLVGAAYDAAFYLAKTEDTSQEVPIEEDYYVAALEWIEANGADVATSSLGYIAWYAQTDLDGMTAVTTQAVNIATANGLVCVTAAGNRSHDDDPATSSLLAPGDAFDVITCGAVDSNGEIANFSSDGPTADGRVKPEVLARGVSTATVSPDNDTSTNWVSGTSLSTPLVAAAAALVVQAHPDWTVAQVRAALMRSASDFRQNGTFDPAFVRGYGIIDVIAAIEDSYDADFNRDGNIDLIDYEELYGCLTPPGTAPAFGCEPVDLDGDNDIDTLDFQRLQADFTKPL
jgi:subtilisin family serine protease